MNKTDNRMLEKLFFNMLPVQVLIFAMGSVNSIVDGVIAGQFIGPKAVGVVGLYYSMVNIYNATGSVLLGGTAVLCGRYMGRGDRKKTEGIFSLNLTLTFIIGVLLTFVCLVFRGPLAVLLGATEELKGDLVTYITGYALGILPMLLAQQIAAFLQLERRSVRGYIGVAGMIISNVSLDILFVSILKMGIWGLALATSFSNIVYFLILVPYYFTSKAQLHYSIRNALWSKALSLVKIGFPGALLVFCIAIRFTVINHILIACAGNDGISAMGAFNMIHGLIISYCLGNGAIIRMLVSVFMGEQDKSSIKKILHVVFTKALALSCVLAVILALISPGITRIFFADSTSNVYHLLHQLLIIYSFCMPLILICQIFTNYLQAMGHTRFVNFQSVFDGFFSMVLPALVLAPVMGALGVWLSNPIGIILTIMTVPLYCIIYWKRIPASYDEWLLFSPGFGADPEDCFAVTIHDTADVTLASAGVQDFCERHDIGKRSAYFSALCLEEMAVNVVKHGFMLDSRSHTLDIRAVYSSGNMMLRLRDDCIPFDPSEMAEIVKDSGSFENNGIRMVYNIADEVTYQNLLGMNVLTVKILECDLGAVESTDYLLETKLKEDDPELHKRFKDTVFVVQSILNRYKLMFPEYTDHSIFHSLTVIDSCNRLIGEEQIDKLNTDEIFILLMGCYLHDVGMGISENDFLEFKDRLGEEEYFRTNPGASKSDFVRDRHNEFSGLFIEKYADLFDLPTPEHTFAIKQVARGHRKTDLFDEKEYPAAFALPNGNSVCLPYLASLLRIADEIDVVATRNPILLYDIGSLTDNKQIAENKKLNAIKTMMMTKEAFVLTAHTDDSTVYEDLVRMTDKMQKTLDLCRKVIAERTDFRLIQKRVILRKADTAENAGDKG